MRLSLLERHTGAAFALSISMVLFGSGCSSSTAPSANSFTEVYAQIIGPSCTNDFCHYQNVGIRYGALDMSTQIAAYWSLADVLCAGASCSGNGNRRVVPGDPSDSILYLKVSESSPPCGAQMPADEAALRESGTTVFSGTPLTADQQQLIYNWIYEGAQNN
jgi:hypothetical protein